MKEYKVVRWKVGLTNNNQRLEDILNEYAQQGWTLKEVIKDYSQIIFERNKNR